MCSRKAGQIQFIKGNEIDRIFIGEILVDFDLVELDYRLRNNSVS